MPISNPEILVALPDQLDGSVNPSLTSGSLLLENIIIPGERLPEGTLIQLLISTFTLPPSLATSSSFKIATYYDGYKVDETTQGFTFKATEPEVLLVNNVYALDTKAGSTTTYYFELKLTSSLTSTNSIYFTLPADFGVSSTCFFIKISSNLDGTSPDCSPTSSNRTIKLSRLVNTNLSSNQIIKFNITNIRNPQSTAPTGNLTIQTLLDPTNIESIVDQNNSYSVRFISPGLLSFSGLSVSPLASVTSHVTSYTFEFVATNPVTTGGRLQITIPKEALTFPSAATIQSGFSVIRNINPLARVSVLGPVSVTVQSSTISAYIINVTNAFANNLPAGTSFAFSLSSIKNPMSTKPIPNIYYSTYTSLGYVIDTLPSPGFTLQMVQPHQLNNIVITPETLQNGLSGSYTFEITIKEDMYQQDRLLIIFPTTLDLNLTSVSILRGSPKGFKIASFTESDNQAIISLSLVASSIAGGSKLLFKITQVKNLIFTSALGAFTVEIEDKDAYLKALSKVTHSSLVTVPAILPFPQTTVVPSSLVKGQTGVTYEFRISRVNNMNTSGYIEIKFPNQILVPSVPVCNAVSGVTSLTCSASIASNKITINGVFASLSTIIALRISPIANPNLEYSDSFSITTFNSGNVPVDQRITDLRFHATCQLPCKTCSSTVNSQCTSCFDDATSLMKYFYQNSCLSECPAGTTAVQGTCVPCDPTCATCDGTPSICTSCKSTPKQLFLNGTSCLEECPTKYYKDMNFLSCEPCESPCDTCTDFNYCSTCLFNKKSFKGGCYDSCPISISIDKGLVCETCSEECATCTNTVSSCTSCSAGYKMQNNQCVTICPAGSFYNSTKGVCDPCSAPCSECFKSPTKCTLCQDPLVLTLGQCATTCPPKSYIDSQRRCQSCSSNCEACTASNLCTTCSSNYLLAQGSCVTTCPTGSFQVGTSCVTSQSECSSGYYLDTIQSRCFLCAEPCTTCFGPSTNQCNSCKGNYLFFESACVTECPVNITVQVDKTCQRCNTGCSTCIGTVANCTACYPGYIFNKEQATCSKEEEPSGLAPFPFIIMTSIIAIFLGGVQYKFRQMLYCQTLLGVISIIEPIMWIVFLALLAGKGDGGAAVIAICLCINYGGNVAYFVLMYKILKTDSLFIEWRDSARKNKLTDRILTGVGAATGFKAYLLIFGKFFNLPCFSAEMQPLPKKVIYILAGSLGANLLAVIRAIVYLASGAQFDQASITAIEVTIINIMSGGLTSFIAYKGYQKVKTYKPNKAVGESRGTKAGELDRSKVNLMEDESQLYITNDITKTGTDKKEGKKTENSILTESLQVEDNIRSMPLNQLQKKAQANKSKLGRSPNTVVLDKQGSEIENYNKTMTFKYSGDGTRKEEGFVGVNEVSTGEFAQGSFNKDDKMNKKESMKAKTGGGTKVQPQSDQKYKDVSQKSRLQLHDGEMQEEGPNTKYKRQDSPEKQKLYENYTREEVSMETANSRNSPQRQNTIRFNNAKSLKGATYGYIHKEKEVLVDKRNGRGGNERENARGNQNIHSESPEKRGDLDLYEIDVNANLTDRTSSVKSQHVNYSGSTSSRKPPIRRQQTSKNEK